MFFFFAFVFVFAFANVSTVLNYDFQKHGTDEVLRICHHTVDRGQGVNCKLWHVASLLTCLLVCHLF